MSKKKLLEENTVRKFMKFANIGHLAESYLDEAGMYEEEEEEGLPPEAGSMPDEILGVEDEMPDDEEGAMDEAGKEELLAQVVQAVADTLGVEAEVQGAGEMAPESDGMDDFTPADEAGPEGEEMPAPEGEEEEEMMGDDDEVVEGIEVMDEDSIVQETVKRVTSRLKALKEAKKKEDLVESITSRIIDALRSKK